MRDRHKLNLIIRFRSIIDDVVKIVNMVSKLSYLNAHTYYQIQ